MAIRVVITIRAAPQEFVVDQEVVMLERPAVMELVVAQGDPFAVTMAMFVAQLALPVVVRGAARQDLFVVVKIYVVQNTKFVGARVKDAVLPEFWNTIDRVKKLEDYKYLNFQLNCNSKHFLSVGYKFVHLQSGNKRRQSLHLFYQLNF